MATGKDLVVYHNVSAGKLREAIKLGGLPTITYGPATGNAVKYQGAYNPTTNAIEIFDGANQSTVVHEGGHMFLTSLLHLSRMNDEELREAFMAEYRKHQTPENREKPLAPRDLQGIEAQMKASWEKVEKDLKTIRDWASFYEGGSTCKCYFYR